MCENSQKLIIAYTVNTKNKPIDRKSKNIKHKITDLAL